MKLAALLGKWWKLYRNSKAIFPKWAFTLTMIRIPQWLMLWLGFWLGCKRLGLRNVRWGITEHGFGCYSRATHEDGLVQGPRMQRWLRRLAELKGKPDPRLDEYRWLLEELRVSLFAQELRTPQPVSAKRLDKAWGQVTG